MSAMSPEVESIIQQVTNIMEQITLQARSFVKETVAAVNYINDSERSGRMLKWGFVGAIGAGVIVAGGGAPAPYVAGAAVAGGAIGGVTGLCFDMSEEVLDKILAFSEQIIDLSIPEQILKKQELFDQHKIKYIIASALISLCAVARSLDKLVDFGYLEKKAKEYFLDSNLKQIYEQLYGGIIIKAMSYSFEKFKESVLEFDRRLQNPGVKEKIDKFYSTIDSATVKTWTSWCKQAEQLIEGVISKNKKSVDSKEDRSQSASAKRSRQEFEDDRVQPERKRTCNGLG